MARKRRSYKSRPALVPVVLPLGMTRNDRKKTRTFAGPGSKSLSADRTLTARQRLARDIRDVRSLFGRKYNVGMQEMLDYAKTLPEFQK